MNKLSDWRGVVTPLVTPIDRDESLDVDSLRRLAEYQLEAGVHGFWVMGTSAEFAGFNASERAAALECVVRTANQRVPVICNVSAAATRESVILARDAEQRGADAIAATPPYYYPHSQDEVLTHFRRLRDAVNLPLFIYNIPQTVRVRVELATAYTLIEERTVAGIKDSQNDLEWFRQLTAFASQYCPDFVAFAGTRCLIDAAVLAGAAGVIPNIANAFPELCIDTYERAAAGDFVRSALLSRLIVRLDGAAEFSAGSRNARTLGAIKALLARKELVASASLTSPLRTPTKAEQDALFLRVDAILSDVASNIAWSSPT